MRHFLAGAPNYAGGSVTLTHTYLQSAASTSNLTTYTFAGENLGTAASDRTIIVVATCRGAAASGTSATIAGITATVDISAFSGDLDNVAIFRAEVPSGTTGDIVVNWGASQLRCSISTYRVVGGTVELDDTAQAALFSTTATNLALSPTTSGGVAVAGFTAASGTAALTWTNATEDADAQVGAEASRYSAASAAISGTSHTITVQSSLTTNNVAAAAAYRGTP